MEIRAGMSILLDRAIWGTVRYLVEPGLAIGAVDGRAGEQHVRIENGARCPQGFAGSARRPDPLAFCV